MSASSKKWNKWEELCQKKKPRSMGGRTVEQEPSNRKQWRQGPRRGSVRQTAGLSKGNKTGGSLPSPSGEQKVVYLPMETRETERESLSDQENLIQSKNKMMHKVEITEFNVTPRPQISAALNELGCHPFGGRLEHFSWEKASEEGLFYPNNGGPSRSDSSLPNHPEMKATACHATHTYTTRGHPGSF